MTEKNVLKWTNSHEFVILQKKKKKKSVKFVLAQKMC